MAGRIEIELPSEFSDGVPGKWPVTADFVWEPADKLYIEKLADLGRPLIDETQDGEKYVFKGLPKGYRTYTKIRKDGKTKDRYVFGHPRGRFDSPNKFFVHFKWLMQGGTGSCECVNCRPQTMRNAPPVRVPPLSAASDPYVNDLSAQLEKFTSYFEENPDDMSEQVVAWEGPPSWGPSELLMGRSFEAIATRYRTLPSFLPRKGELVLFYLNEEPNCRFQDSTQHFKMYDGNSCEFLSFPTWRAGVIATEPEDRLGHEDLSAMPYNHLEVTDKSFRIELYPDPKGRDKSLSDESYHIPLNRIRPFSLFHEFLSGIPQADWHETIHNALKSVNTTCLVDPIELSGKWSSHSLRCRGIWIGPELYVNGDAVRLMPAGGCDIEVDQVMIINRIDHRFENENIHDERSSIVIAGPVISINKKRSLQSASLTTAEKQELLLPASTGGYTWYPVDVSSVGHPAEAKHERTFENWQEVPASYVVGRLYDLEAMKTLLNISNFDVSGLGMKQARRWAKKYQITTNSSAHQEWILTTDRIEALDIEKLNGQPVGKRVGRTNLTGNSSSNGRLKYEQKHSQGSGSSRSSNHYNGSDESDKINSYGRKFDGALEKSFLDGTAQSDTTSHLAQSFKSVNTDHRQNWSEDEGEDENAENFISEVIAENLVAADEHDMDRDIADGAQNGERPKLERPMKRPRL